MLLHFKELNSSLLSVLWFSVNLTVECDDVSDKKAAEIPSDLLSVSAENHVTVANLSRNCLTAVPARLVFDFCDVIQHGTHYRLSVNLSVTISQSLS